MIKGLHQRHYKNAIINVLEAWGGEAYGRDVMDALMNDWDGLGLVQRRKSREAPVEITNLRRVVGLRYSNCGNKAILSLINHIKIKFGGRHRNLYLQITN